MKKIYLLCFIVVISLTGCNAGSSSSNLNLTDENYTLATKVFNPVFTHPLTDNAARNACMDGVTLRSSQDGETWSTSKTGFAIHSVKFFGPHCITDSTTGAFLQNKIFQSIYYQLQLQKPGLVNPKLFLSQNSIGYDPANYSNDLGGETLQKVTTEDLLVYTIQHFLRFNCSGTATTCDGTITMATNYTQQVINFLNTKYELSAKNGTDASAESNLDKDMSNANDHGNPLRILNPDYDLTEININARPLLRAIVKITNKEGGWCTGIEISSSEIKTAGHCIIKGGYNQFKKDSYINVTTNNSPTDLHTTTNRNAFIYGDISLNSGYISHNCGSMSINENWSRNCAAVDEAQFTVNFAMPRAPLADSVLNNVKDGDLINSSGNINAGTNFIIVGAGGSSGQISYYSGITQVNQFTYNHTYNYLQSSTELAEEGDSGGPLFVCNASYSKCKLVALISGSILGKTVFKPLYSM